MAMPTTGLIRAYLPDTLTGADLSSVTALDVASQATTADQPKLRIAAIGGHKAIELDGLGDRLAIGGAGLDDARNRSNLLVFVVYKMPATSVTGVRCLFSLSTGTTTGARVAVYQREGAGAHQAAGRRLDADAFAGITAGTTTTGETAILTARIDWANSDIYLYKNGTQIATSTSFQTSGVTSDTSSLTGFIGANPAGAENFQGQIGAVLLYDGTTANRAAIHSWLQDEFEVTVSDYTADPANAIPSSTIPGFQNVYSEDFNTDVAEGGFVTVTTGSDLGLLNPSSPGGTAYANSFKVKQNNSSTGEASGAVYSAQTTTSVTGSVFRVRMHTLSGVPQAGAMKPLLPLPNRNSHDLWRIRYRARLRGSIDPAWGTVFDTIDSNTWQYGTGEYGHPENGHTSGSLGSFIRSSDHQRDPNRSGHVIRRNAAAYGAPSGLNDWHTYEQRFEAGRTRLYIDGVAIWDSTVDAPDGPASYPMGFLMQNGAPGTPTPGTEAIVEIDWVSIDYRVVTGSAHASVLPNVTGTASATGTYDVTTPASGVASATGTYVVTSPVTSTTVSATGSYTVTSVVVSSTASAGEPVLVTVPSGTTAVAVTGATQSPATTQISGTQWSFIAPILTTSTVLTVTASIPSGPVTVAQVTVNEARRRVYHNGAWVRSYLTISL